MNDLLPFLGEPWVRRLGWVLIHFLWQGTVIALALAVVLRISCRASSHFRYLVIAACLALCGAAPIVTWVALDSSTFSVPASPSSPSLSVAAPVPLRLLSASLDSSSSSGAVASRSVSPSSLFTAAIPYVVVAWLSGLVIFSLRLTLGWSSLFRLRHSGSPLQDPATLALFHHLLERFGIRSPVRLARSLAVEVPTLIGWLRPIILLPAAALTGLSRQHLEAIIAHELAHVRRWDYAVNFLQTIVETVLFYHPAVWWISRTLREERENCCDDLAIEILQDRLTYISALASLEECRLPAFTLSASGSLLRRIRRIVGASESRASFWPLGLVVLLSIACLTGLALASDQPTRKNTPSEITTPLSQSSLNRTLVTAASSGDLKEISRLLALGADPNSNKVPQGNNALFVAAVSNQIDAVKLLLAHGANPDCRNVCDNRPIEWVLNQGHLAMATLLHDAGAQLDPIRWAAANGDNATVQSLLTPGESDPEKLKGLYKHAVSMGHLDTVKLIEKITGKPIPGSLLKHAATSANIPMMEYILSRGADLQKDGGNAIDYAVIFYDQPASVKFLLDRGIDPNRVTGWSDHLLSSAKSAAMVKLLLDAGADPNVEDRSSVPLVAAPDAASVRLLIQHGADVKHVMKNGNTLIEQITVSHLDDRAEVLKELIKQGATFDPRGNGIKALSSAAFFDKIDLARVLLDHGVDPNAFTDANIEVRSILASAAYQGSPELLQLLLDRGAIPNGLPNDSSTPLFTAASGRKSENIAVLLRAGANNLSPLTIATANGDIVRVRELLQAGANVNETDPSGNTALIVAVLHGDVAIARTLLEAGANPSIFNQFGLSSATYFNMTANPERAEIQWKLKGEEGANRIAAFQELFTKYPLDPRYRDSRQRTYLHQAAWVANSFVFVSPQHPDPNLRDQDGRTPLLLAALSPAAADTADSITILTDPKQSDKGAKWNSSAYMADQLLKMGADPDLPMPGGQTVRSLALAAAQQAHNDQLVAVLKDARRVSSPAK